MKQINCLDLFSGIGGFPLGMKRANISVGWHGYSDIDKYANQTYRRNFKDAEELGPVGDVLSRINTIPRIDIVNFGFPCQDLAQGGKRRGFEGSRSSLFFEAIEIIRIKRPKFFIFENVKGFLTSNRGEDFTIALRTIADIGYDGQWQLLNTRKFLPQHRERVYFVGYPRGECRTGIFPIGRSVRKNKQLEKPTKSLKQYARTLTARGAGEYHSGMQLLKIDGRVRVFTEKECERLQGFPDNWTEGVPKKQRYKQCGNAVSVPVVQAVMEKIKCHL